MAKQKKQLRVLLILMVIGVLAYLGILCYTKQAEKKEAENDAKELVVAEIDPDEVDAFSYMVEGTAYSFTKDGTEWSCDQEPERKLKSDDIASMLKKAAHITAEEQLEDYDSLADYGLDEPQNKLTFTCGGTVTNIRIGSYNEMLGEYYLMVDGGDAVYLVDSTLVNAFSKTLEDLTEEEETEESEEDNELGTEAETEKDNGSGTDTESEAEEDNEPGTEAEKETETDNGSGTESETDNKPETEAGNGAETGTES